MKVPGRVGDSGVLGAGTFADNRTCAVSATGDGELFIRSTAAHSISARMLYRHQTVTDAAQEAVDDVRNLGGIGGLIALDHDGRLAMPYHAVGMYRGSVDEHGDIKVALYND
jgi:beta-aspartyl-peptidase (threonine type)